MTTFDDRENAFENKFAHDQEMSFRVTARRNKLVGQWAAAKMGLTDPCLQDSDETLARQAVPSLDYDQLSTQGWVKLPLPEQPFADGGFLTPGGRVVVGSCRPVLGVLRGRAGGRGRMAGGGRLPALRRRGRGAARPPGFLRRIPWPASLV